MPASLYFAYGSNLSLQQFARRCPGAKPAGRARLVEYRLAFTRYSTKRKGGVADIVPEPGATVWGALYEVDESHLMALDEFEGVPRAYLRQPVRVLDDGDAEREALAYFANRTGEFAPSRAYLDIILRGARDHGLPEDYTAALEGLRTYA